MTDADTIPEASDARSLALILDGSRMLAEARDLFAVRHVRALAVAATAYAKARDLGADAIRQASTIVILATERLGEEIAAGQEAGTIATAGGSPILRAAEDRPATLADLGITANLAAASQRLAADPAAVDAAPSAPSPASSRSTPSWSRSTRTTPPTCARTGCASCSGTSSASASCSPRSCPCRPRKSKACA